MRHKRGDKVHIAGTGREARVEKTAACRCGWRDESGPAGDVWRAVAFREHMEDVAAERERSER